MKQTATIVLLSFLFLLTGVLDLEASCNCTVPAEYASDFQNCVLVTTTSDNSSCGSLRYALNLANQNNGGTYIMFNIVSSGEKRIITLLSNLPIITKKIFLDATTQIGFYPSENPRIVINSNEYSFEGLVLRDLGVNGSIIQGLEIKKFRAHGILLRSASNIIVSKNVIYDGSSTDSPNTNVASGICAIYVYGSENIYIDNNFLGMNFEMDPASINPFPSPWLPKYTFGIHIGGDEPGFMSLGTSSNIFIGLNGNKNYIFTGIGINNIFVNNCGVYNVVLGTNDFISTYIHSGEAHRPSIISNNTNMLLGTSLNFENIGVYRILPWFEGPTSDNLFYYQYLGTTTADNEGNWSFPFNIEFCGMYKALSNNSLSCEGPFTIFWGNTYHATFVDFEIPSVVCLEENEILLQGTTNLGSFSGNGVMDNKFNPALAGSGFSDITFNAFYSANYWNSGCDVNLTKKIFVIPQAKKISRVLSASSVTYSDEWPKDFSPTGEKGFMTHNPFVNGSKGSWRAEESYVYVDERKQEPGLDLRVDGIIKDFSLFDWSNAFNGQCDGWRKVNTITEYSPDGIELENKDILGTYSSAIYGFGGELPLAVVHNAANFEAGFESFEEYNHGASLNPGNTGGGKLGIFTSAQSQHYYTTYKSYSIETAVDNELTIDLPYEQAQIISGKTISVYGAYVDQYIHKGISGSYTVSSVKNQAGSNKSVLVLSDFPGDGIWKGKISVPYPVVQPVANIPTGSNSYITNLKAHTGKNSFRLRNIYRMEQYKMDFVPGEQYHFSCWMSLDDINVPDYNNGTRYIEFYFRNALGQEVSGLKMYPSGEIIEGWQKIEGSFQVPVDAQKVILRINVNTNESTYFDDFRLHPFNASMQSYVYDKSTHRLAAVLDDNNYATLYYYDESGRLYLVKKETEKGIYTLKEHISHQRNE